MSYPPATGNAALSESAAIPAAASNGIGMLNWPKGVTRVSEITSPPGVVDARSE